MLQGSVGGGFRPYAPTPPKAAPHLLRLLWLIARNPILTWTEELYRRPVVVAAGPLGVWAFVSEPAAVRRVLVDNVENYPKDAFQLRILKSGLGEGLLTTDGEVWRRTRRTLAPLFAPRRQATLARRMREVVQAHVASWGRDGRVVDLGEEMVGLTFSILTATLFPPAAAEDSELERLARRFVQQNARISLLDVAGAPSWVPRPHQLAGGDVHRAFRRKLYALAAERRGALRARPSEAADDLLSTLVRATDPETGIGLSESEVVDNLITFLLAGHETTARALAWTFYLLTRAPEALARVEAEADAAAEEPGDWLETLPWTRAVLEEAMRLFPPAPALTRTALAPDQLSGIDVPAGASVAVTPYIIHRHQLLWAEPDVFAPERFLPGAREAIDRFAYMPFGAGPRVCIGQRFAMQEAVIALSTLCRAVRFEPLSRREVRPVHRLTLRPHGDLKMRVRRRAEPAS